MWYVQGRFHIPNISSWELWLPSCSLLFYQTVHRGGLGAFGGGVGGLVGGKWALTLVFVVMMWINISVWHASICIGTTRSLLRPGNAPGSITWTGSPQQPTLSCLLTGRCDWQCHLRGSHGRLMWSLCEKPCCHTWASNNGNLTSEWEDVLGKHRRYWFSQSKPEHGRSVFPHVTLSVTTIKAPPLLLNLSSSLEWNLLCGWTRTRQSLALMKQIVRVVIRTLID